ncbi:LuxR family transcriptional regulator [Nocardia sp. NPDC049707]|uniref:helix-turn-helix transcriptional regulator n=1 Tax=Nocardia sp. NPDC049707 TaxID=3154735 RepID=UPI00341D3850
MDSRVVRMVVRDAERQRLSAFVTATAGQALILRGASGVDKNVLLDYAIELARREGHTVVRAVGVEAESALPYAGLHQLLYPLFPHTDTLDERARAVFDTAFRSPGATPPSVMTLGIAVLDLLSVAAAERPLLLVLDDGHWVDEPSAEVCGFVGRRLGGSSAKLLIALRAGTPSRFDTAVLPETPVPAPWAERARGEPRATDNSPPGQDVLTWQERRIADLAARGLTNKEIGRQLYLSPRTVSSHLYRIFPKLGITTRAALRDALNGQREAVGA